MAKKHGFVHRGTVAIVVVALVLTVGGAVVGFVMMDSWNYASSVPASCDPGPIEEPPANLSVTGLPTKIPVAFGVGRGSRDLSGQTFAAAFVAGPPAEGASTPPPLPANDQLPAKIAMNLLPLEKANTRAIETVSAYAERVGGSQTYRIHVCITANTASAGSYQAKLLFSSGKVSPESTPVVEATFQNRLVPFFFAWIPLLALIGLSYTATVMIRRADINVTFSSWHDDLVRAVFGVNGLLAFILAVAAAFGTWKAACYANTTWGADWPDTLVSLGAILAASTAAATPVLALAKAPPGQTRDNPPTAGTPTPPTS